MWWLLGNLDLIFLLIVFASVGFIVYKKFIKPRLIISKLSEKEKKERDKMIEEIIDKTGSNSNVLQNLGFSDDFKGFWGSKMKAKLKSMKQNELTNRYDALVKREKEVVKGLSKTELTQRTKAIVYLDKKTWEGKKYYELLLYPELMAEYEIKQDEEKEDAKKEIEKEVRKEEAKVSKGRLTEEEAKILKERSEVIQLREKIFTWNDRKRKKYAKMTDEINLKISMFNKQRGHCCIEFVDEFAYFGKQFHTVTKKMLEEARNGVLKIHQ